MLAGCEGKEPVEDVAENQELETQEEEKDYENLQKMVDFYDKVVGDGLPHGVKNLAKNLSNCDNKCKSEYMTYEDAQELVETEAYNEWFDENYVKPVPNTTPLNSLASVSIGWGRAVGEGNSGLYQVGFNVTNESYTHTIKGLEVEVLYEYDKQRVRDTRYLEVSIPSRTSEGFDYMDLELEPFDLHCKVISVDWEQE